MTDLEVNIDVTPVYVKNKAAYDQQIYRVIANEGSTRSSKSFSICQLLVDIANEGKNDITKEAYGKKEISIVSPSLPHLKKGVRKDTLKIIEDLGIFKEDDFNRTDNIYTFADGSTIEFFGAEDSKRVRGPGRQILYINEANLLSHDTYIQLALRTSEVIFIDYNPADEFSWVYDVADKEGNKKIHSTYLNNKANLPKFQIDEIEGLQDADQNLWKVFGLGLRGTSSETIYTHWKTCKQLPESSGPEWYGQDFGYNVQSGLVKVKYHDGSIYAKQLLYETKLTTTDLIERYKDLGISKSDEIYCDAAEPKTIKELTNAMYNAKPADKDVTEGIKKVKSIPLFITEDSVDLIKEIKSYKWKLLPDGKVSDEPVKFHDHLCDALRYAVFTKLHKPQVNWAAF